MKKIIILFITAMFFLSLLTGIAGLIGCKDKEIPVKDILFDRLVMSLEVGQTNQFVATVIPKDADDPTLYWSSEDEKIAEVNDNGEVRGISVGSVTIFVTDKNRSVSKSLAVIVTSDDTSSEKFPILAWDEGYPGEITVERCKVMKEAGITHNFVRKMTNAAQVQIALDAALSAGIKMLIYCPELESNTRTTVERFMNHPALAGYNLHDEPNRETYPIYGALGKAIKAIDDKHFCYT
jgi:hypothetical protein